MSLSTRIIKDAGTNRSRGFGFVEFGDIQSATRAIKLNGVEFCGRRIKVNYSEPRKPGRQRPKVHAHPQHPGYPPPYHVNPQLAGYYANIPIIPNSPPQNQIHPAYAAHAIPSPPQNFVYQSSFVSPQSIIYNPQVHNPAYAYESSHHGTLSNVSSSSDLKHYDPVTLTTPEKNLTHNHESVLTPDPIFPYQHQQINQLHYSIPVQNQAPNYYQEQQEGSSAKEVVKIPEDSQENETTEFEEIKPSLPPQGPSLPPKGAE